MRNFRTMSSASHRTLAAVAFALVASVVTAGPASAQRTATLSLDDWLALKEKAQDLRAKQTGATEVVISEARYEGKSDGKNLLLSLRIRALIQDNGGTEPVMVPVAPRNVVVRNARFLSRTGARDVGLLQHGQNHVWETKERGPVEIVLDIVVPPSGPRGSFEYVFPTIEAVRTTLRCFFPENNLVPRVDGASDEVVVPKGQGVELYSVLKQTRRIRISGFHEIEEEAEQDAKVYVDGQHLLSIEEDRAELFSVLRLHILYARKRRFQVVLPQGYELVQADGEGAFRSAVEQRDGQQVLVGETATGMKDRYEISLRLRRTIKGDKTDVPVVVPRLLGAERDTGTVAVELPGRLTFEGHTGKTLRAIDPRELPQSLIESSVSPIIAAFRYAEKLGTSTLKLRRVPAHPVAAGGIDRMEATTVITGDGRQMTDVRFTLRNLLRRHLAVKLPSGAKVESVFLDGVPVKPSTVDGQVLLPLARSARVNNRLKRIHLQLVYIESDRPLGMIGKEDLALPVLDVPVSSVIWKTYVPRRHRTAGSFDKGRTYVRSARFERPQTDQSSFSGLGYGDGLLTGSSMNNEVMYGDRSGLSAPVVQAQVHGAGQGAMPVRVNIPTEGRAHNIRRDWVREGEQVKATLWHAQVPVVIATKWAAALGLWLFFFLAFRSRRRVPMVVAALGAAFGYALIFGATVTIFVAIAALLAAIAAHVAKSKLKDNALSFFRFQAGAVVGAAKARLEQEKAAHEARKETMPHLADLYAVLRTGWLLAIGATAVWLTFFVLGLGFDVLGLLQNPL